MTATPSKYDAPYVSEIIAEADRTYDDCAAATGIMLAASWTLGEAITKPDGSQMDVNYLRNALRARIGKKDGGLTLHDMSDLMQALDPELPPLPRYNGQRATAGQSTAGATLTLTFEAWKAQVMSGYASALCGNPSGVKNPDSPLRSVQGNDDYAHVIHVSKGDTGGALVKDPLTRHKPAWPGVRVSWDDLRQYTEAKKNGDRQFGSPGAIACAMVATGGETEAARTGRKSLATIARLNGKLTDQKAQTALAIDERDQAKRDLSVAVQKIKDQNARIAELEGQPSGCTDAVNKERARVLDALSGGVDELVATLR